MRENLEEEVEALLGQWRYAYPEDYERMEEEGVDMHDYAKRRIISANQSMASTLQIMNDRLRETVSDPEEFEREKKWNEMTAWEMKAEDLKYI